MHIFSQIHLPGSVSDIKLMRLISPVLSEELAVYYLHFLASWTILDDLSWNSYTVALQTVEDLRGEDNQLTDDTACTVMAPDEEFWNYTECEFISTLSWIQPQQSSSQTEQLR
jgi:hypothetical protein